MLASASPEFYVREIGKVLGFDISLGTQVEIRGSVPLFPDLVNHKGSAKVRRLQHVLGPAYFDGVKLRDSHGYSDSVADLPMLALCNRVTMVNPCDGLAAKGEARGWGIVLAGAALAFAGGVLPPMRRLVDRYCGCADGHDFLLIQA